MKENWYALLICLETNCSINQSLLKMGFSLEHHSMKGKKSAKKHSDEFINNILNMRNSGMKLKDIAAECNLTFNQVHGILNHYSKKATKNTRQNILSSKTKNIHKNSTSLYHMEGGNQVAN